MRRVGLMCWLMTAVGCRQILGLHELYGDGGTAQVSDSALDGASATTCVGSGTYAVCFAPWPDAAVILPATIDTDNSSLCGPEAIGWAGHGQSPACFVVGASVQPPAPTGDMPTPVQVIGSKPLVIAATGTITIGVIDASSRLSGRVGAAANDASCGLVAVSSFGGGPGGSFVTVGGPGGSGNSGATTGANAATPSGPPSRLRGGCPGAGGAGSQLLASNSGGAIYVVSATSIVVEGVIDASGEAGGGGARGGTGGATGGMIVLAASTIDLTSADVYADGGGGGGGGCTTTEGADGKDADGSVSCCGGGAGSGNGGSGGTGEHDSANPGAGLPGGSSCGGGGGGGAAGYIVIVGALTTDSNTRISPTAAGQ